MGSPSRKSSAPAGSVRMAMRMRSPAAVSPVVGGAFPAVVPRVLVASSAAVVTALRPHRPGRPSSPRWPAPRRQRPGAPGQARAEGAGREAPGSRTRAGTPLSAVTAMPAGGGSGSVFGARPGAARVMPPVKFGSLAQRRGWPVRRRLHVRRDGNRVQAREGQQRRPQRRAILVAMRRVLREQAHHDRGQLRRRVRPELAQARRRLRADLQNEHRVRLVVEGVLVRERLEEDHTEAVEVGAVVDALLPLRLLGEPCSRASRASSPSASSRFRARRRPSSSRCQNRGPWRSPGFPSDGSGKCSRASDPGE